MITEVLDLGGTGTRRSAWLDAHELGAQPYFFSKELRAGVHDALLAYRRMQRGVRTNSVCPSPIDTPLLDDFRETMTDKLIDWSVAQGNGQLVTAARGGDRARVPRQRGAPPTSTA